MASFDFRGTPLGPERFLSVAGGETWQRAAATDSIENWRTAYHVLRRALDARPPSKSAFKCPRVFISHRQNDGERARRIAWLAARAGFQFWLDILDPFLIARGPQPPTDEREALITACLIEIALLNCSHVLAVITPRTRGSMWVPYEYGRVKSLPAGSEAACWISPRARQTPQSPEYLYLGEITKSESDITVWFNDELVAWNRPAALCVGGSRGEWPQNEAAPPELPESKLDEREEPGDQSP